MELRAFIFDIKRDCSEDGPGIRTTVFFKGCPLSCDWCQNPEGQHKWPGLSFRSEVCDPLACGFACIPQCEVGCLSFQNVLQVDFDRCMRCGACFEVCPPQALEPVGYTISLKNLLYRVLIDEPFYRSSGGGVTLSGGEATSQMPFASAFLKALKSREINTAIETCGFFDYPHFQKTLLPYLDWIYFDLKLIDERESLRYTSRSSRLIFENFSQLIKEAGPRVIARIPLIPGITDSPKNLSGIAGFLKSLGAPAAVLLPYNPLWHDKLKRLNLPEKYARRTFMTQEEKEACRTHFSSSESVRMDSSSKI